MKYQVLAKFILLSSILLTQLPSPFPTVAAAAPLDQLPADTRCPVCGMFVAKYDVWITQIRYDENLIYSFDGVKDMMAYYFDPAAYAGSDRQNIREIWVKDYYSLKWVDGHQAFYVLGSDVHGPMGHELVPFETRAAAEAFQADHHGTLVLSFSDIDSELIERLRVGNKMKNTRK